MVPDLDDDEKDTLLNPVVLFEVLSPSTEDYDRGGKFKHYRTLPSLQEYVLISQDRPLIEHYVRQQDQWIFTEILRSTRMSLPTKRSEGRPLA